MMIPNRSVSSYSVYMYMYIHVHVWSIPNALPVENYSILAHVYTYMCAYIDTLAETLNEVARQMYCVCTYLLPLTCIDLVDKIIMYCTI